MAKESVLVEQIQLAKTQIQELKSWEKEGICLTIQDPNAE